MLNASAQMTALSMYVKFRKNLWLTSFHSNCFRNVWKWTANVEFMAVIICYAVVKIYVSCHFPFIIVLYVLSSPQLQMHVEFIKRNYLIIY